MKNPSLFIILTTLFIAVSSAQTAAGPQSADHQWRTLGERVAGQPKPTAGRKTRAQMESERTAKVAAARAIEAAARDFYTKHPSHPNVGEAKKVEVVYGLRSVTDDAKSHEQEAIAKARAYASDINNVVSDRFEVALLLEQVEARNSLRGAVDVQNITVLEQVAERLRSQFGDRPEIHSLYMSIARSADMTSARRIVTNVMQSSAPEEIKQEAQAILARLSLVGQPVKAKLKTIDGQMLDLQQAASPTLLYFARYRSGSSHGLLALRKMKQAVPSNARVVYIVIGAPVEDAQALKSLIPIPGAICSVEPDDSASIARHFNINRAPYVCWLNRSGVLTGFGPVAEVASLVQAGGS